MVYYEFEYDRTQTQTQTLNKNSQLSCIHNKNQRNVNRNRVFSSVSHKDSEESHPFGFQLESVEKAINDFSRNSHVHAYHKRTNKQNQFRGNNRKFHPQPFLMNSRNQMNNVNGKNDPNLQLNSNIKLNMMSTKFIPFQPITTSSLTPTSISSSDFQNDSFLSSLFDTQVSSTGVNGINAITTTFSGFPVHKFTSPLQESDAPQKNLSTSSLLSSISGPLTGPSTRREILDNGNMYTQSLSFSMESDASIWGFKSGNNNSARTRSVHLF